MAEVADHLVPVDGLTNSSIRYAGLDTIKDQGGATHHFDIHDEDDDYVGTFKIETPANSSGSIDAMVLDAHRQMVNVLRQWLHAADALCQNREK